MVSIFWESSHRARRYHHCDHCHFGIEPGERYTRYAWVPERGRFYIIRQHVECPPEAWEWEEAMHGLQIQEAAIAIMHSLEIRAVVKVKRNGEPVTEYETVVVTQLVNEEDLQDFGPDEEVPF